jgi:hypothetical protein
MHAASLPSSSTHAKQMHQDLPCSFPNHPCHYHTHITLALVRSNGKGGSKWTYANGTLRSTGVAGPPPIPPRVSSISLKTHARLVRGCPCTSSRPWVGSRCRCPRTHGAAQQPMRNLLQHRCTQAPQCKAWPIACARRAAYLSPPRAWPPSLSAM